VWACVRPPRCLRSPATAQLNRSGFGSSSIPCAFQALRPLQGSESDAFRVKHSRDLTGRVRQGPQLVVGHTSGLRRPFLSRLTSVGEGGHAGICEARGVGGHAADACMDRLRCGMSSMLSRGCSGGGCVAAVRVDAGSDLPACGRQVDVPLALTHSGHGIDLLVHLSLCGEGLQVLPPSVCACVSIQIARQHDDFGSQRSTGVRGYCLKSPPREARWIAHRPLLHNEMC
jgi:hypothetical protein